MNRRNFLSLAIGTAGAAGGGLLLGACGTGTTGATGRAATHIRVGDNVAADNCEIAAERYFGERLSALSGGRYTTTVYPDSALGDAAEMNEGVRAGTLELTKCLTSNLTPYDKRLGVLTLPYLFARQQDLFDALAGSFGTAVRRIIEGFDMVVLGYFDSGARSVYNSKRPVRTPADLKGLRIRVPQDVVALDTFNTLGAHAIPLVTGEVASALRKHVIDGAENNIIFYQTNKHADYANYYSWTRHQFGTDALLASKKWFTALPAKDRDLVMQAGHESVARERQLWTEQTRDYTAKAAARKIRLNDDVDVAAFQRAVKRVLDKHRSAFGDLLKLLQV